ncbi:hypothetical protein, partial [Paenibacillus germinis]|uniref:hypothetical protein n=1 Tax=Paenibacillus germinis TaxID=2654979 RepID=UPI001C12272E
HKDENHPYEGPYPRAARESRGIAMNNIAISRPRPSNPFIRMKIILMKGQTRVWRGKAKR